MGVVLIIKQFAAAIVRSEPSDFSRAVLADPSCKIIRHADVEDGILVMSSEVEISLDCRPGSCARAAQGNE